MTTELKPRKKYLSHTPFFDAYWQCEVKWCSQCLNKFPLTEFYRSARMASGYKCVCKRCDREISDSWKWRNRKHVKKMGKKWAQENRDRVRANQTAWLRRNKEKIYLQKKLAKARYDERVGASRYERDKKTREGKINLSIRTLRRWGFSTTSAEAREKWMGNRKFNKLFRAWEQHFFKIEFSPVLVPLVEQPATLDDFGWITYAQQRSEMAKSRWKAGAYDHRRGAPRKNPGVQDEAQVHA